MIRAAILGLVAGLLGMILTADGRASLHHPIDTYAIPVNAKGQPDPLPFEELARRRLELRNIAIEPKLGQPRFKDREVVAERIKKEEQKRNRTPEESVALAVDLLRFGRPDDAEGALRGQRRGFLANITLAHIAIAQDSRDRPGWARAFTYLDIANEERPPKELPGLSTQQLKWQLVLNRVRC